jgi:hypothetical protein
MSKKEEMAAELKRMKERAASFNQAFPVGTEIAAVMADKSRKIMVIAASAMAKMGGDLGTGMVEVLIAPCLDADPETEILANIADVRPRSIERKKTTDALRVILTPEERMKAANEAADAVASVATNKANLDSMKSSINSQIKMKESEIAAKSELVRNGYEIRPVELTVVYDFDMGRVQKIRKDTGEIIEDRMIQDSERNSEPPVLFLVEPQEPKAEPVQTVEEGTQEGQQELLPSGAGKDQPKAENVPTDDLKAAFEVLKTNKRASAATFSRLLNVSTRRSVQILDALQSVGVVGPAKETGGTRDILVDLDTYQLA